jgi:hypothetical protein
MSSVAVVTEVAAAETTVSVMITNVMVVLAMMSSKIVDLIISPNSKNRSKAKTMASSRRDHHVANSRHAVSSLQPAWTANRRHHVSNKLVLGMMQQMHRLAVHPGNAPAMIASAIVLKLTGWLQRINLPWLVNLPLLLTLMCSKLPLPSLVALHRQNNARNPHNLQHRLLPYLNL